MLSAILAPAPGGAFAVKFPEDFLGFDVLGTDGGLFLFSLSDVALGVFLGVGCAFGFCRVVRDGRVSLPVVERGVFLGVGVAPN